MNNVSLIGRLVKDPELRYSQGAEPMAIARYTIAVNRSYKREGEPNADFINCVSFGKTAEFIERYFNKGTQIGTVGKLQVRSWEDTNGNKKWSTEVIVNEVYFADSKQKMESKEESTKIPDESINTINVDEDDLPF